MRNAWGRMVLVCALGLAAGHARAAEWFVATNGNDAAAGTNWATAKLTIQAAVDAAASNDTVWVSNGVYVTGGRAVYGAMTNRVAINKPIAVRSVNGSAMTVIKGAWDPVVTNGNAAVRCAYVGTNAMLIGFTLINGATHHVIGPDNREFSGGGVWCEASGVVSNCLLTGNTADHMGGGAFGGTLNHCILTGNSAWEGGGSCSNTLHHCSLTSNSASMGGGAAYSTLNNCALIGNTASSGGGSARGNLNNCSLIGNTASSGGGSAEDTLNNCIVYYNAAGYLPNYVDSAFAYSCTTPRPEGEGNITNEPWLASASHLSAGSPCIGAGSSAFVSGTDLDGESWFDPPSMGCDEMVAGSITGALNVGVWAAYTNVAVGVSVSFRADIDGRTMASVWQWADGRVSSNLPYAKHVFPSGGIYEVSVIAYNESHPLGVAATLAVAVPTQTTYYVRNNNPSSLAPYVSWASAATNIQDAIDAVPYGGRDLVLVSNGVYAAGGRTVQGALTNRVVIDKGIMLQSVNGPAVTFIKGARHPGTTNGNAAVRCVFMGTNAVLSGFTLTNGATRTDGGSAETDGGGVWVENAGVLTNCILAANSADKCGGGAVGGALLHCRLIANAGRYGGGAAFSALDNCRLESNSAIYGGGSEFGWLTNCILIGNSAAYGGGSADGSLNSCLLTENSASAQGGGSYYDRLDNCTVVSNSTGSYHGTLTNCIVYFNKGTPGNNHASSTFSHSCTIPDPGGTGNITNDPRFVDAAAGNFRLQSNSPCINRGNNDLVQGETDLDGNPRIAYGTVDMGAYEAQFPVGYWAWASEITNGLTNDTDCAAGDGVPNLLKYATGGSPIEPDDLALVTWDFESGLPTLVFNRNPDATDVTLVIQGADEMSDEAIWRGLATNVAGSWGGATNVSESGSGTPVVVTVEDALPLLTNRFLRLKVTRP